jgi:DNA-binding XRE family transcriptional regulator
MPARTKPRIPEDTFGCRLAVIRADAGGLNVKQSAKRAGISDQTWRTWEAGSVRPRDYLGVCRRIAEAFDVDMAWLALGGPLARSSTKWYLTTLEAAAA